MSTSFVVTLIAIAAVLLIVRWVSPALPIERFARRLSVADLVLVLGGILGLILHCASMFFRPLVAAVPGTEGVISQINSMGVASMIWYAIPALMLLVGLRRQHWVGLLPLVASLLAVGITMYDGSALSTHLVTIFVAGVMIAAFLFLLSTPPWVRRTPS